MNGEPDPIYQQAIERLRGLFEEAQARGLMEPNAASLATTNLRGQPSIRTISVLEIELEGPLFFVDLHSGKGRQVEENPCAALCFFWPQMHRQVVVEGHAEAADAERSDRHWANRPREAQLAAWAGGAEVQPDTPTRGDPLARIRKRFAGSPVPRPPNWRALHLQPDAILFWRLGWRDLHARERFARDASDRWQMEQVRAL